MEALFRKFRSKQGEVWQLGCFESPLWSLPEEEEGGPLFRPCMAACWSVRTGRLEVAGFSSGEPGAEVYREVVVQAVRAWRLRPERIEVADARLAEDLDGFLSAEAVAVKVRDELPELRAVLEERARDVREALAPPALSVPEVTVERMAAFAGAAARFSAAAPWLHLRTVDYLVLASDGLPAELRFAQVFPPPVMGVQFHAEGPEEDFEPWDDDEDGDEDEEDEESREEDEEESWEEEAEESWEDGTGWRAAASGYGPWRIVLGPPFMVPPEDVELWVRHDLPLAHSKAYPMVLRFRPGGGFERPDASLLAWFEAVLAALAATTEEEMDTGRWDKEVATAEGPVRLGLSLPGVLRPSLVERLTADDGEEAPTPEKLAERLAGEARDALGRRQIHLARRAVALWPGCVDAWLVLARLAPDREAARDLYAQAVAAGERLLPRTDRREAWFVPMEERLGILPYVWARIGLAKALWDLGAREEAAGHFQGILAVDGGDSAQVRYLLAHALLALGRAGEAEDLLARSAEDRPGWHYTRALLTFHHEGDSPAARRHLAAALRSDRPTAQRLLRAGPVDLIDLVSRRDRPEREDDAFFRDVWTDTPGALEWLRSQNVAAARAPQARKKKRKGKKSGKRRRR